MPTNCSRNMEKFINELNSKKYKKSCEPNQTKPDDTDCKTSFDLRAPLDKGWKRETTFEHVTSESKIQGEVIYYSPGSQRKLSSIEQIQKVLDKRNSSLTIENFSFSTQQLVGTFLQHCNGRLYKRMTDVEMTERLNTVDRLRKSIDSRKITKVNENKDESSCLVQHDKFESFETASLSGTDSDDQTGKSDIESDGSSDIKATKATESRIRLQRYGSEERNFYDENGFMYSINNNSAAAKSYYFRCKNDQKYDCKARAISKNKDLNNTILKGEHTHSGNLADIHKMKFCYKLDKEIRKNPLEFGREVYLSTMDAMVDEVDVYNLPDKTELSNFIYRRKRKFIPKLPKTVADFEEMINIENYKTQFTQDKHRKPFYRGIWKSEKGGSNIAFISETVLKIVLLMSSIVLRMDGTFKVLPKHMKLRQLFIISVIYRDKSYPLAYILTQKRNYDTYDNIFSKLKEFIPSEAVSEVMADYEAATRKAVVMHFPKARLVGCWFHYVQAINRVAKRFGLSKDDKFSDAIKYISALALLPQNYILDGFNYIDSTIVNSYRWDRFKKYWLKQWSRANISVYGIVDRTNNYAESLNKSLNVLIGARHPNIWKLIERVKLLDLDYSNKITKASGGKMFKEYKKEITTALNKQIKNATEIFDRTKDVQRFLQNATYDIRLDILLKERLNFNEMDDDEKDDYVEIIPNSFNPVTMRKRSESRKPNKASVNTESKKKRM